MGLRETKAALRSRSAVRSFQRKSRKHWTFQRRRRDPETVVSGGNGGGKGAGFKLSLRGGEGWCGDLRGRN